LCKKARVFARSFFALTSRFSHTNKYTFLPFFAPLSRCASKLAFLHAKIADVSTEGKKEKKMFPFYDHKEIELTRREVWAAHSEVAYKDKRIVELEAALENAHTREFEREKEVVRLEESLAHLREQRDHWKNQYENLAQNKKMKEGLTHAKFS
jgi:chromosome segregation ATPase